MLFLPKLIAYTVARPRKHEDASENHPLSRICIKGFRAHVAHWAREGVLKVPIPLMTLEKQFVSYGNKVKLHESGSRKVKTRNFKDLSVVSTEIDCT